MNEFCHIHVHSSYSLLDAISPVSALVNQAKELGYKSLALTDHGNMHGAVEFYNECKKAEINPILGCEFYVARDTIKEGRGPTNATDHLLVVAENLEGYQNLLKLATLASTEGFHYVPRVDRDILSQHSSGLIATSSCMLGAVARLSCGQKFKVRYGKGWRVENVAPSLKTAAEYAMSMQDIFGKGNFFLEIQDHKSQSDLGLNECRHKDNEYMVTEQKKIIENVAKLAKDTGMSIVATNDVHFTMQHHWDAKDTIFAIRTGQSKKSENRNLTTNSDQFYLKSQKEMCELFKDHPEAIKNTLRIAERCKIDIPMGVNHIPKFETKDVDLKTYWRNQVKSGFEKRYRKASKKEKETALERIGHELKVIEEMGFVSYFLMVADFIDYARNNGVPVGPGRGSAAGSIVSYCLGITDLCPLEHGLLFERFLNSERVSLPDIDIDFCKEKVGKIYKYAQDKYGVNNVARIATFGTMWARSLIRTIGTTYNMPKDEVSVVAGAIPEASGEFRPKIAEEIKSNPTIKEYYERYPEWKEVLDECVILEGCKRSIGKHAAGIVIGDNNLVKYIPLMRSLKHKGYKNKKKGTDEDVELDDDTMLFTQIPMDHLEDLGLIKMDFLALETLTIIQRAIDMINANSRSTDSTIKSRVPLEAHMIDGKLDDKMVFDLMKTGKTLGVFQVESSGLRDLLVQMQPTEFSDIVDAISLYRPGPMDFIDEKTGLSMLETYVFRRNRSLKTGTKQWEAQHPTVEKILDSTYGVLVYQEQLMNLVREVCNFTMNDADRFRKAVGKKIPELVEKERKGFIKGALNYSKMGKEEAETLFDSISAFSRYAFNKSHAAAYSLTTYRTAWLKAHYPVEFMCALLTSAGQKSKIDDRRKYIEECTMTNIPIYAPDILKSNVEFKPEDINGIRAGLSMIKGVDKVAAGIVKQRNKTNITNLYQAIEMLQKAGCNKGPIEALIYAGALDCFLDKKVNSRAKLLAAAASLLPQLRKRDKRKTEFLSILPETGTLGMDISAAVEMTKEEEIQHTIECLGVYRSKIDNK